MTIHSCNSHLLVHSPNCKEPNKDYKWVLRTVKHYTDDQQIWSESSLLCSLFVIRPKVWTSTSTNLNIQGGFGSFRSTLYPSCLFDNKISAASTSDNSQNTFVWINSNTLVKVYNANPSTENAHNNRTNHTNDLAFAKTEYYTGRLSPSRIDYFWAGPPTVQQGKILSILLFPPSHRFVAETSSWSQVPKSGSFLKLGGFSFQLPQFHVSWI